MMMARKVGTLDKQSVIQKNKEKEIMEKRLCRVVDRKQFGGFRNKARNLHSTVSKHHISCMAQDGNEALI